MPFEFRLPDIGEGLEDAEIVTWYVSPGDVVERDQALLEVLTDKASSELPSPVAGTVMALNGQEGERIKVGDVLIQIEEIGGNSSPKIPAEEKNIKFKEIKPEKPITSIEEQESFISVAPKVKASPATRKLARELTVDISEISGTGPSGRITTEDVKLAARTVQEVSHDSSPTAEYENLLLRKERSDLGYMKPGEHKIKGVRGVIAKNMSASWAEIPHIHSLDEVDASLLIDFRNRIKKIDRHGASKITPLSIVASATVRALKKYPMMNGHVVGTPAEKIIIPPFVNLGIAVASDSGLLVPVINQANDIDIFELAEKISELVELSRDQKITADQMQGATFTITNYGSLGGRWALPIISLGQAGILGVGKIEERPFVVESKVEARPTMPIVLAADHRLIDGDVAEAFKNSIMNDLLEPLNLLVSESGLHGSR
jgi:pyruvate dehydrogenase E2 component (dihydrolipoamide acetyltransferase)